MLTEDAKRIKKMMRGGEFLDGRDWKVLLEMNKDVLPTVEKETLDPSTGEIRTFRYLDYTIPRDEALQILKKNRRI